MMICRNKHCFKLNLNNNAFTIKHKRPKKLGKDGFLSEKSIFKKKLLWAVWGVDDNKGNTIQTNI